MNKTSYDAVIVGAGPNGLTAAVVLAQSGLSVAVLERSSRIGGGCRSEPLTLPGFTHDVCGAIHPMGLVSPVFRKLRLTDHGLQWVTAPAALAHPFDDGRVVLLSRDFSATAEALGRDGSKWVRLLHPFVERVENFVTDILRPLRWPRHPLLMARFGRVALRSCERVAHTFDDGPARAVLAGNAAHSFLPLDAPGSSSFGLVLAVIAHAADWPCAKGGSQQIVDTLAARARTAGCEIHTDVPVRSLA
jgi:phytoene dehydrogenase-like protein